PRAPAAPLGSRRLADSRLALSVGADAARSGAESPSPDQPLEDPRQPEKKPHRAEHVSGPRFGLGLASRGALGVDAGRDPGSRAARLPQGVARPPGTRRAPAVRS